MTGAELELMARNFEARAVQFTRMGDSRGAGIFERLAADCRRDLQTKGENHDGEVCILRGGDAAPVEGNVLGRVPVDAGAAPS